MSADNYYVVRRDPGNMEWVVSMGFMSEEIGPCMIPVSAGDPRFKNHDEAVAYACENYSEYGEFEAEWCLEGGHRENCDRWVPFETPEHLNGTDGQEQP